MTYTEMVCSNDHHCLNILSSGLSVFPDGTIISQRSGKVIKPSKSLFGYARIRYQKRNYSVHRMVLLNHMGRPPEGLPEVNHIDGDRLNNSIENLEWSNRSGNTKGIRRFSPRRKLRDDEVLEIRRLHSDGVSVCELSRRYGVAPVTIQKRLKVDYRLKPHPSCHHDEVMRLLAEGMPCLKIDRVLGFSVGATSRYLKGLYEENSITD